MASATALYGRVDHLADHVADHVSDLVTVQTKQPTPYIPSHALMK